MLVSLLLVLFASLPARTAWASGKTLEVEADISATLITGWLSWNVMRIGNDRAPIAQ